MGDEKKRPLRIAVINQQKCARVRKERLREIVARTLELEGVREAAIGVALVDDEYIQQLNRRHLGHDCPTDVISFPYNNSEAAIEGDIVVSVETARREASKRRVPIEAEVVMYVVHGLLHLLGYDDTGPRKRKRMWQRQREILAALGYPVDPLFRED